MNTAKQEKIALFRFGIIFPLLDERLQWGDKSRIIREICDQKHDIPYSNREQLSKATIYNWLRRYSRKQRIEDLYPSSRRDKGQFRKLSSESELALRSLRDEHPDMKLTTLVKLAIREGVFLPSEVVSMSLIYRVFKDYDLQRKAKNTKDMRRFSMEHCNDTWMLDAMTGPKVTITQDSRKKIVSSKLWAYIDDKSRLITYAAFYKDETAESLIDCTIKAFSSRGLPRKVFTDNGPAMRDHRLKLALADLQVHLSFAKPYSPASKAKIERFFLSVRMQFLPLQGKEPLDLYELNKAWKLFVQQYNTSFHSGIKAAPLEIYLGEIEAVRPAPPHLKPYFRKSERRKVTLARTVSLYGTIYEVPIGYAGLTIELRFFDPRQIEAFYNGTSLGLLKVCDQVANSRARRIPLGGEA